MPPQTSSKPEQEQWRLVAAAPPVCSWCFIGTRPCPFIYLWPVACGRVCTTTAALSSCNRDHVAHEALNIYLLVPNRTSLLWTIAKQHHLALAVVQPQPMSD